MKILKASSVITLTIWGLLLSILTQTNLFAIGKYESLSNSKVSSLDIPVKIQVRVTPDLKRYSYNDTVRFDLRFYVDKTDTLSYCKGCVYAVSFQMNDASGSEIISTNLDSLFFLDDNKDTKIGYIVKRNYSYNGYVLQNMNIYQINPSRNRFQGIDFDSDRWIPIVVSNRAFMISDQRSEIPLFQYFDKIEFIDNIDYNIQKIPENTSDFPIIKPNELH